MRATLTCVSFLLAFALIARLQIAAAEERTWTDASGKSMTAELVEVQKTKIVLRDADGKEITVPLKNLSEADRAFAKQHAAEHPAHDAKADDSALTAIAKTFYSELRTTDRDAARQTLTVKAQKLMKGEKSALAELPTPDAGNHAIRIGPAKLDGDVAEVPVQVRAGGTTHKTKLHLRHEDDQWRVFAVSADYPDGEKSLNFEAAAPARGTSPLADLVGKPFSLEGVTTHGQQLSVDQYKGKVVLVDFWATWCGPCRAEIPNVLANYQQRHNDGFDVIAVSVDEDMDALKSYVAEEKPPWTVVAD
ncbi:MAG TPA: TlpA disulfide reductase family protein, partial [Lacipirellulaceae bacterium]